jgi:hypothetical protein
MALCVLAGVALSCSASSPVAPGTPRTTVLFVYHASTLPDPTLPPSTDNCQRFVGSTHVHPSWRNFQVTALTAVGTDRWEVTLNDVPVGPRNSIQVADANACLTDPDGWVTQNVTANGTALVDVIQAGGGRALAFTVAADGRVTP